MTRVVYAAGARALEPLLLQRVAEDQARVRDDLSRVARPLRVVVPSHPLREHLASALVRHAGRPLLGVRVQTLSSLAHEVLERAGLRADPHELFPVLVRRAARQEPSLREALDDLSDGYGAVRAAVDDLFDAGFTAEHAEPIDELLSAEGSAEQGCERAVVRVAARVHREQGPLGVGHRARRLTLAREAWLRDPARGLPARGVLIHGFADATGVVADWLEALVRLLDAEVFMSQPQDPTQPDSSSERRFFGASLRERLEAAGGGSEAPPALRPEPPRLALWKLRDPSSEVRVLASALRGLLDQGVPPESLAVVARDLTPYRLPLRRHLTALAIPFSGVSEGGPVSVAGRRLGALLDLLREGESLPAERWLEAAARLPAQDAPRQRDGDWFPLGIEQRADLQHALHRAGCVTLADATALPPGRAIALDVPRGLPADAASGERAPRRELEASLVGALVAAARALLAHLAEWPATASWPVHASRLRDLVAATLGWDAATPGESALEDVLACAVGDVVLERDEFLEWLVGAVESLRRAPLGGAGGGVQVLSVMEARGLCFEHVFLLGMSRGVFPRVVREDPLLSDPARRRLRDVLPDLPVKREGFDEERFLFADLLAGAETVTLSHPVWNDAGQPLAPSPLLEGFAAFEAASPAPDAGRMTARERALRAGLRASREDFESALEVALAASGCDASPGLSAAELARVRVRVLRELDPGAALRATLGPYLGFVGAPGSAADPRRAPLHVTQLERLARCPWKTFLERQLRLAPPADARGPLPQGGDSRLVGNLVHRALEEIARLAEIPGRTPIDTLRGTAPRPFLWPESAVRDALLERCAETIAREEGLAIPSFARALARRARGYLDEARRAEDGSAPSALGVESHGLVQLRDAQGRPREVRFIADRVDVLDGALRITDYKTGNPPATQKGVDARVDELRKRVAAGTLLQASAYAFSDASAPVEGRYLYLAPDASDVSRVLAAPTSAEDRAVFEGVVRTLLAGLDAGCFLPRMRRAREDLEPRGCTTCEVKDACLRGDSGARARLGAWAEAESAGSPVEGASRALWNLDV